MTRATRWITSIVAVILGLALIILAGIWRLGLLTLLFPPPAEKTQVNITENNPVPVSTYQQPQQPAKTAVKASAPSPTPGKTISNSTSGPPKDSPQPTQDQLQQQIDDYYGTRLQSLANSYEGQLNGLVGEAYSEYQSDKEQGKDVSVAAMAFKYMSEGNALEQQCDAQFYPLLDEFEADLKKNNLPLDTAIKAKQEYESSKANRKEELLSAAAKMI